MQFAMGNNNIVWGAAAASYQIEGKLNYDPRGKCVWDMFCETPGNVFHQHNGDQACMHVRHFRKDAKLMGSLRLQAYRLSISWPRILPTGRTEVSKPGLDFYDQLVDNLLEQGIDPWVTLFHWDYPYDLYLRGGWLHPDSPKWFADYTQVIVKLLSDRVQHWMTLNEPQCFIHLGHHTGYHAPGLKLGFREVLTAAHNSLLAHGMATQVIRNFAEKPPVIGAAPVGVITVPKDIQSIRAAKEATFAIKEKNTWNNTWFADPMILGEYPEDGLELFAQHLPTIGAEDMKTIQQPLDFYGANIYTAQVMEQTGNSEPRIAEPEVGEQYTSMDWQVVPDCLYWASHFFHERYRLPIVVTENGMANNDYKTAEGEVHDPQRIDYMQRHINKLLQAKDEGVPIKGYFAWSIMDNFEWAYAYDRRFGLVHIDYQDQTRTPKSSAYWYRDFIAEQMAQGDVPSDT